jgi:hypothetical protein
MLSTLSNLELQNIIESSFLPARCRCTLAQDQTLTVRVFEQNPEQADFVVTGIQPQLLTSSRAISNLVGTLRRDLANTRTQGRIKHAERALASL